MSAGITGTEIANSLTGYDEIAIKQQFGGEFTDLTDTMAGRAMVFIHKRREGMTDPDAKAFVMGLGLKAVGEYFDDEPDDLDPDEPDTEAGKDSAPTA